MKIELGKFFTHFDRNPPANGMTVEHLQASVNFSLPPDYVECLLNMDGGEGFIGGTYLLLWRVGELIERNARYRIAEFAPGLFIFGSDGGDEAFCFDHRSEAPIVVSLPFVGMHVRVMKTIGSSFKEFLEVISAE